jgi:CPA2 family monovalent cation:H+ antiporter-2
VTDLLRQLVEIVSAALLVVLLLDRLRLPTIAGFIVAGALIGPSGFGLIADRHEIERLAEIGVVLLLFTIGLEFSLEKLRRLARVVALGGGLQVGLTTAAVVGLASAAGLPTNKGIFLGFLAALSSTAIVLKGLAERGETDAPHGKVVVGALLFQDLCVVPMILLVPLLAGTNAGGPGVGQALLTAAAVVAGTLVLARRAIPQALRLVAATGRRDLFILAVILVCAGIGWLTSLVGLSLALGAFLAGVVLADSEYGHQALSDVLPLRDIFTSLFFISMGMLLDARVLLDRPGAVLGLTVAVLGGKALLATLAGLAMRFPLRVAVLAGLGLAQVGEFSFVLAELGAKQGLLAPDELRLFFAMAVVTMLVTPFALRFGPQIAAGAARLRVIDRALGSREDALVSAPELLKGHVVVLGFGVGGEMLAEVLGSAGIPHVVVDINAERVRRARQRGEPVYYGDVTSAEILERVRVADASQVALMINDPDATMRAVRAARRLAPQAVIIARARYVAEVPRLIEAGASEAVAQEFEASLEIIGRVAKTAALDEAWSRPTLAALRGQPAPGPQLPVGVAVESVPLREDAWIVGRSLSEAQLRSRTGATLVALTRGEATAVHPAAEDVLQPGDVLCLVGDASQIAAARRLLASGPNTSEGSG